MEKLVYLDQADGIADFLAHASWRNLDGIEVDLTDMSEDDYAVLEEHLVSSAIPVKSLHYERTNTVSLQEWELFKSQLEMLVRRANQFGCDILSVHPPKVERESASTMKELQEFMAQVDAFAAAADVEICFELTGFMKDPQLINTGFAELTDPALGVMVDLESLVDGIDPLSVLEKLDVKIHKVRFPMSVQHMDEHVEQIGNDVAAVATSLD